MTTLSKLFLITVVLCTFALAQSAPKNSHASPSKPAASPAATQNGKGQKDAAAKGSAGHTSNMSGNHKDIMGVAADKNQGSTPHSGNMIGNHKDVMEGTAPATSTGGKTQSATTPAASPAPSSSSPKK
jgi:hypothetical protein